MVAAAVLLREGRGSVHSACARLYAWTDTLSRAPSYTPSQADVSVFEATGKAPDAGKYPHAARWYEHIESYKAEHKSLSGDAAKAVAALA